MSALVCRDDTSRRELARRSDLNGLDYLEVADDQRSLTVFFLGRAPDWITAAHLRLEGGERVRDIRILSLTVTRAREEDRDDCMKVVLDRAGDFSTYRLCVVELDAEGEPTDRPPPDFDPRYACLCFSFKAACPSDLDCSAPPTCPKPEQAEPAIDYLAKDFASFRRLIMDRLALIMPGWQERQVPDIGVTLVELVAYVGDYLSYYQDAVATEAYLETARRRVSVRRHARLVDYNLHEGCTARALVTVEVSEESLLLVPGTFFFTTGDSFRPSPMIRESDLSRDALGQFFVFEPVWSTDATAVTLYAVQNEIRFYTWHGHECCLPRGATRATLVDPGTVPAPSDQENACGPSDEASSGLANEFPAGSGGRGARPPQPEDYRLALHPCDILIFEEVRGPHTGNPADADPTRRHAVRLTSAERSWDPLTGQLLLEIEWAEADALPFPLCLSSTSSAPECAAIADVSIARGNVILTDHGRSVSDPLGQVPTREVHSICGDGCLPPETLRSPGSFSPRLPRADVTFATRLTPCPALGDDDTSAQSILRQDPRAALPALRLHSFPAAPDGTAAFSAEDIADPTRLAHAMAEATSSRAEWLRDLLAPATQAALSRWVTQGQPLPQTLANGIRALLSGLQQTWEVRRDLLASGPDDRHAVLEIDDDGYGGIRFGDGNCGRRPDAGDTFLAEYRIGNGAGGNVGADTITRIVFIDAFPSGTNLRPRNPLPASGGHDPEPTAEAKLRAPHLFRSRIERAVTPADYAAIVERDFAAQVQRAAGAFRWTGIGSRIVVAVDTFGEAGAAPILLKKIARHLESYRRLGHDLEVTPARTVPLSITLAVCVRPDQLRGHVRAALLDALGPRRLPGGGHGLFYPDALSFGEGIHLSRIITAAQAVQGVESLRVTQFERLFEGPNGELAAGILRLGPFEIARLDNDPNHPEHGQLTLTLEGGR